MNKARAIFLSFLFFFAFYPVSSARADTEILYKTSYICRDLSGKPRWRAEYEIRREGDKSYSIIEKGRGYYSGFEGNISWVEEAGIEAVGDTIRPLWMKKRIFDENGKAIAVREQMFDFDNNTVTCTHDDLIKNTSSGKKFKFKGNIINRLMQGLYVQRFIENGKTSERVEFISPEPALYTLDLRLLGAEEIKIDGRRIKAYKLLLDPVLGVFNFVKVFLPEARVWHSARPKFEWLKYEGVESSVKSPRVVITTLDEALFK